MNTIIVWLIFWFGVLGIPNYLFKKRKITYYGSSLQHTLFFIFSILILFVVYRNHFYVYFSNLTLYSVITVIGMFALWVFVPSLYRSDYYTKKERLGYQVPKFFEIFFQQICFLGGLLTFGVSPITFGIVFFAVHVPIIFLIQEKFFFVPIGGSLLGGLVFAYLQSHGILGFLISLLTHLSFWLTFHFLLSSSKEGFLGISPLKR